MRNQGSESVVVGRVEIIDGELNHFWILQETPGRLVTNKADCLGHSRGLHFTKPAAGSAWAKSRGPFARHLRKLRYDFLGNEGNLLGEGGEGQANPVFRLVVGRRGYSLFGLQASMNQKASGFLCLLGFKDFFSLSYDIGPGIYV